MSQVTMTVRTDANLKAVFTSLCEEFGMSANTAMNVFMRAVAETKSIPFTIGRKNKDTRKEFGNLLDAMHEAAVARDEPELTLEEINEEIAAVRAERKARAERAAI